MVTPTTKFAIKAYSYIRMSRDTQLKGDSLRRQREASARYAERHGLELVDDFALEDLGVSAWTGANLQSGNLGRFVEAVKSGRVQKGSYLLVEAFDRISRLPPLQALQPVLDLVNNGITVVTLDDEKVFTADTTSFETLIISIAKMSRANDESARKSERVGKAWANKRKNAGVIKLTARCPGWLKLSADRQSFTIIDERAKIVQRIFDEAVSGLGVYSIARRLNAEGIKPFNRARNWQLSSVHKIVTGRAVVGEYQPHRKISGQRVKEGEPIKGYYPAIITEDLFDAAQHARAQRREDGGGRTGKRVSNLFSKLAVCNECGSPMHFEDKGAGPRGGTYLVCDQVRRNLGCPAARWRYNDFEASFLAFVSEVDLAAALRTDLDAEDRAAINMEIDALNGALTRAQEDQAAAFELHRQGISLEFIANKLSKCEERIGDLSHRLREARQKLDTAAHEINRYYESVDRLHDLIAHLRDHKGDEIYKQRSMVSARLKSLIDEVVVAAAGRKAFNGDDSEIMDLSHFSVRFKNGVERIVYPHPANPLKFVQQVVGTAKLLDVIEPDGKRYPLDDGLNEAVLA